MDQSLVELLRLACCAEVLARKPGNVHPQASFSDLRAQDFLRSADASAPKLAAAGDIGIGRAVYDAVAATRNVVSTNTNLGICLLMAPAAAADPSQPFRSAIEEVLRQLTIDDAAWTYRAIRLASPGGLGEADDQDVANEPTVTLRDAMGLAADRDSVAAQYANGFRDIEEIGVRSLVELRHLGVEQSIIATHLRLMASLPDSLIARKCGLEAARESARRAQNVLDSLAGQHSLPVDQLRDLDDWLRADGHRRNPGTSADLVACSLFVALRWGEIEISELAEFVEQGL